MEKINIGIIAHIDAGKTTLTEHILYLGGAIAQAGRVDKGNTQTDSMAVERRRGISVRAAATSFYRNGIKFNLIDTPGHVDFVAEVERNLAVLDGVVLVISAKEGLQSQTRILMDTIKVRQIPAVIFINKIDRMGADAAEVVRDANEYMDGQLVVAQHISANNEPYPLPDSEFMEMAADTLYSCDDNLMHKFANNEPITPAKFFESLTYHTKSGQLYPVFFGSALHGVGVENLLDALPYYLPAASGNGDGAAPLSAVVFKVDASGERRLVYVRIYDGAIHIRKPVNFRGNAIGFPRLYGLVNGRLTPATTVEAGDIAVVSAHGLKAGDVLGEPNSITRGVTLGRPTLKVAVVPQDPQQRQELYNALSLLADEDPLLSLSIEDTLTVQLFGEIQMEIIQEILAERYNVVAEFSAVRTIYMETPTQPASAVIPLGKTFFRAGVGFSIVPLPRGSGLEYVSKVPLGALEKSFQAAVEEAAYNTCKNGLWGWEMTDMRVEFDYSDYCSVTSTPSAFRDLVPLVLMQAAQNAGIVLLEPIMEYELRIPGGAISKAMYDLRIMNATIDSTISTGENALITGQIPADVCRGYAAKVGSYTEGRGAFLTKFGGYRETEFTEEKVNQSRINPAANAALYVMQKLGAR